MNDLQDKYFVESMFLSLEIFFFFFFVVFLVCFHRYGEKIVFIPLVYDAILNDVIFRVDNFTHALGCLQNWQPMVGNTGTWLNPGRHWHTNGVVGRTPNVRLIISLHQKLRSGIT